MAKNIRPVREQFDTQTELLDVAAKKMITSVSSHGGAIISCDPGYRIDRSHREQHGVNLRQHTNGAAPGAG